MTNLSMPRLCIGLLLAGLFLLPAGSGSLARADEAQLVLPTGVSFTYQDAVGLGGEAGVTRRDPSDVIQGDGVYYVYYTYVKRAIAPDAAKRLYPSGYIGRIWCATSEDGKTWIERGEVLGLGKDGAFDSHAVFTPNILYHGGKYWLYYTGIKPTPGNKDGVFENNNTTDYTAIGLAVSDSPRGPFKRVSDQPILTVGPDRDDFDSYRVDDACLVVRGGKVWLYYKGRSLAAGAQGPSKTRMGVAIADEPAGPYKKLNDGSAGVQNRAFIDITRGNCAGKRRNNFRFL